MTQTTITKKQENKGAKAILALTGAIGQVLKQYQGIYGAELPETDGLTVETWNDAFDFHRFVGKNGKKGGYTPGLLNAALNDGMKIMNDEGKVFQNLKFKNVAATYVDSEDSDRKYRVYATKEAAEDPEGKSYAKYGLVGIDPCKWSIDTIIKVLRQSKEYDKHKTKADNAATEWDKIETCYIAKWVEVDLLDTDGNPTGKKTKVRKAVAIPKTSVQF